MRKLILLLICSLYGMNAMAQTPTLQQKLYYTCKVWGFVKYYHSNVSTCHVNWDSVLLHTLPLVRSAASSDQFNDALDTMLMSAGPMAISTSYFPDTLPAKLKRNRDWNWIAAPALRSDVQTQLDTIKNNFRPNINCWVTVDSNEATRGFTESWGGYLDFPLDTTLLNINTLSAYPDNDHRQLMLFKYWNIMRYFNPNNYVLDVPWDTTLYNNVIPMDVVGDPYSLYLLVTRIETQVDDAHTYGFSLSFNYGYLPGIYAPKIFLKYVDGQYVVAKSEETGIYPGDVIIFIDGMTTTQWEDSLKPYYSSGNLSILRKFICQNMMCRETYGTAESMIVEDSTGANHSFNLNCNTIVNDTFYTNYYYPNDSLNTISWTTMPCDVGYVNMGNLQYSDVTNMYNDLQEKSAIIFDLRNYPNGTAWSIADLMYPNVIQNATFLQPDVTYPGTYYQTYNYNGVNANPSPYTGQVIILMNEVTESQAEYSCMLIGAMPGAIKVGSQTAGADGDITWFKITDDLETGFSSLGVFYPNGDSTQRIGIVPDSVVYPTRAGIRHHNDEVLNKALQIAGCGLAVPYVQGNKTVVIAFPNPANDVVNISIASVQAVDAAITLTDVTGRVLMRQTANNTGGHIAASFDTRLLAAGMYFVIVNADGRQYVRKIAKE